jgi:hypothetical protein
VRSWPPTEFTERTLRDRPSTCAQLEPTSIESAYYKNTLALPHGALSAAASGCRAISP